MLLAALSLPLLLSLANEAEDDAFRFGAIASNNDDADAVGVDDDGDDDGDGGDDDGDDGDDDDDDDDDEAALLLMDLVEQRCTKPPRSFSTPISCSSSISLFPSSLSSRVIGA